MPPLRPLPSRRRKGIQMEYHELANLFPLLSDRDADELAADIAANGQREPIVIYEGKILDGRNRFRACTKAGVTPRTVEYQGDDPLAFVISLNLKRRHLDESQRGLVAGKIATIKHGQNQWTGKFAAPTQAEAASMMNVSERTVRAGVKVQNEAAPELIYAVESGAVSVSAAADVAELPKAEQAEIVAKGEKEIIAAANKIKREKKERRRVARKQEVAELAELVDANRAEYTLHHDSFMQALDLAPGSVDWVVTDPPYPREFLHLYNGLGEVAAHVLKPGGSLICMVGQSYLPEVINHLSKSLTYHWTLAYMTPGGQATQLFPRRVNTFWKPVLWFVNDEYSGDWIGDVTRSNPNDNDKRFHHWGQSESGMADLMSRFVKPGDVVLDPFMGAGTTGAIAMQIGARFIGYDEDVDAYNEAVVRLDRMSMVA